MIVDAFDHKWSCAKCISGHRTSTCDPSHGPTPKERNLFRMLRRPGKPGSRCGHCKNLHEFCQCHLSRCTMTWTGEFKTHGRYTGVFVCNPTFVEWDYASASASPTPEPVPQEPNMAPTYAGEGVYQGQYDLPPAPEMRFGQAALAPVQAVEGLCQGQYDLPAASEMVFGQAALAPMQAVEDPNQAQYAPFPAPEFDFGDVESPPFDADESMNQADFTLPSPPDFDFPDAEFNPFDADEAVNQLQFTAPPAPEPEVETAEAFAARAPAYAAETIAELERLLQDTTEPENQGQYTGVEVVDSTGSGGEMEVETLSEGEDSGEFRLPSGSFDVDEFSRLFRGENMGQANEPDYTGAGLCDFMEQSGLVRAKL